MDHDECLKEAECFMKTRQKLRTGPFYTGSFEGPGKIVHIVESAPGDHIKRYTDRYLHTQQIGNTEKSYPFVAKFFPLEIQNFISGSGKRNGIKDEPARKRLDEVIGGDILEEPDNDQEREADERDQSEAEQEDEFEEFEDDDYNAEKYFDDGDDYGDIDDDGGEAAY